MSTKRFFLHAQGTDGVASPDALEISINVDLLKELNDKVAQLFGHAKGLGIVVDAIEVRMDSVEGLLDESYWIQYPNDWQSELLETLIEGEVMLCPEGHFDHGGEYEIADDRLTFFNGIWGNQSFRFVADSDGTSATCFSDRYIIDQFLEEHSE